MILQRFRANVMRVIGPATSGSAEFVNPGATATGRAAEAAVRRVVVIMSCSGPSASDAGRIAAEDFTGVSLARNLGNFGNELGIGPTSPPVAFDHGYVAPGPLGQIDCMAADPCISIFITSIIL